MLKEALSEIICKETNAVQKLIGLLEEQHRMIVKNDIFGLEGIVERLQSCNREIAELEVQRRKLVNGESMRKIIDGFGDEELDRSFRNIQKLLIDARLQKDTNEMLIKQGLGFSSRMLNVINPDRKMKTYNSYGQMRR